jgi:hypothetical protein
MRECWNTGNSITCTLPVMVQVHGIPNLCMVLIVPYSGELHTIPIVAVFVQVLLRNILQNTGKSRSIVSCTSYYIACRYRHKTTPQLLRGIFQIYLYEEVNIFGVKIKGPVHPLLPIHLHQRYIFPWKIYLPTKDISSPPRVFSLVQIEDKVKTL